MASNFHPDNSDVFDNNSHNNIGDSTERIKGDLNIQELENDESYIEQELSQLSKKLSKCSYIQIINIHRNMIRLKVKVTSFKQLELLIQYPTKGYPHALLLLELKSKTLSELLLKGLLGKCENELINVSGEAQIYSVCIYVSSFLAENPFCACYDELFFIKTSLIDKERGDQFKQKVKSGLIHIRVVQKNYFIEFQLAIPNEYPNKAVICTLKASNLPIHLVKISICNAVELARKCIEAPLMRKPSNPPFIPTPSLKPVAVYLIEDLIRKYVNIICPLCNTPSLPDTPPNPGHTHEDEKYPSRVLCCAHLYHAGCLKTYMTIPPFDGGKKCLICKQRVYHEEWTDTPKLAEEKWAHKEAKKREISEISDFFS